MVLVHTSTLGTHSRHGSRENMFTDRQTHTHSHTHTHTNYNNPPAHARGLINNVGLHKQLTQFMDFQYADVIVSV